MLKRNSILKCWSNTRPQLGASKKWEPAGRIGDFGNFLNGFSKGLRLIVLNIDWVQFVLNNCEKLHSVRGLYDKKTSTILPQMRFIKRIKDWFTHPQICWRDFFCKVNLSNAKNSAWFVFQEFVFPGLIYCDQEPLRL